MTLGTKQTGLRGPLDNVTVVSLEQAIAGPLATRHLADLGARVIKVEKPEGGDLARSYDTVVNGLSSHFVWANRSKESITLNLRSPAALDVVDRLIGCADVVVENLAPDTIRRLGLEPARLSERYPSLVVCRISGYGDGGPYSEKKAYDLLVQCEAGVLSVTGTEESPAKVGIPIADIAAAMYAFSGIVSALYARERTGLGSVVEISMLEALSDWMSYPALFAYYSGAAPRRTGMGHATIVPYDGYRTRDGALVFLAVQSAREWASFCRIVLEMEDLAIDERFASNELRNANREELDDIIQATTAELGTGELLSRLEAAGVAHAKLNDVNGLLEHPQLMARHRWGMISSPVGPIRSMKPPINIAGSEPVMDAVPSLGEHTSAILLELGFSREEVRDLQEQGATVAATLRSADQSARG